MKPLRNLFEIPASNPEYIPNSHIVDGIAVCDYCNTPKQCKISWLGKETVQGCMCECEKKAYDAEQESLKKTLNASDIKRNRSVGMRTGSFVNTFENADYDEHNTKFLQICERYSNNFEECLEKNIGLKLWGDVGRGKSFAANCIFNRVVDRGFRAYYITAGQLVNNIQKLNDRNDYIDEICEYDLLIIDDLGAERNTETAAQYIEDVIDRRITRNKPLVITTNIIQSDYRDMREERLYSRLDAMCQPVKCSGNDRRKNQHSEKYEDFKNILIKGVKENEENLHRVQSAV